MANQTFSRPRRWNGGPGAAQKASSPARRNYLRRAGLFTYRYPFLERAARGVLGRNNFEKARAISHIKKWGKKGALTYIAAFCDDSYSRRYAYRALGGDWNALFRVEKMAAERRTELLFSEGVAWWCHIGKLKDYYPSNEEFTRKLIRILRFSEPLQWAALIPARQYPELSQSGKTGKSPPQ